MRQHRNQGVYRKQVNLPAHQIADPRLSHLEQLGGVRLGYLLLLNIFLNFGHELGAILMVLTFFASPRLAGTYLKEAKRGTTLERLAETVVTIFPDATSGYARLGHAIFQATLELDAEEPEPSGRPKVGRNDPCSCGSRKKFKKCCGVT